MMVHVLTQVQQLYLLMKFKNKIHFKRDFYNDMENRGYIKRINEDFAFEDARARRSRGE